MTIILLVVVQVVTMKPKQNSNEKCRVCGDIASGLNYKALTCETCKIFFFRNESKKFYCRNNNNQCVIDILNRKSCPKCRLEKCFAVGMKRICDKSSKIDCSLRTILLIDQVEITKTKIKIIKSQSTSRFELTRTERDQIDQVQLAVSSAFEDESKLEIIGEVSNYVAIGQLHWPDLYARKVVKFCKSIPAFKLLNKVDQLILLRNSVIQILAVRCAFTLDLEKKGYPIVENAASNHGLFVRLKGLPGDLPASLSAQEQMQFKKEFFYCIHTEMGKDCVIRDLILAQTLFQSPANVSCPEFIRYHNVLYRRLLSRYLASKYRNLNREERKIAKLTNLMDKLPEFKDNFLFKFQEESANQLPEIFVELLNLA